MSKKQTFLLTIIQRGNPKGEKKEVLGTPYHCELTENDYFLYKSRYEWGLYDVLTGLHCNVYGLTQKETLNKWHKLVTDPDYPITPQMIKDLQSRFLNQ